MIFFILRALMACSSSSCVNCLSISMSFWPCDNSLSSCMSRLTCLLLSLSISISLISAYCLMNRSVSFDSWTPQSFTLAQTVVSRCYIFHVFIPTARCSGLQPTDAGKPRGSDKDKQHSPYCYSFNAIDSPRFNPLRQHQICYEIEKKTITTSISLQHERNHIKMQRQL